MKQEEKTRLTIEKILQAGIAEFGEKGYRGGRINAICEAGINKGLIYHNYKNKDALYLACVAKSFADMAETIEAEMADSGVTYYAARQHFFKTHDMEGRIFLEAAVDPPAALREQIEELKAPLDALNRREFAKLLACHKLRPGITEEMALKWSEAVVNGYHMTFRQRGRQNENFQEKIDRHEREGLKWIEMMLFGIVEKED
jgi:AcrR family transcriptional regulator